MGANETIYILGSGAVGFPLAVYLTAAGKHVVAVRTSRDDVPRSMLPITVHTGTESIRTAVETISLAKLERLAGTIVVAAKSYANEGLARALRDTVADAPIVIMQNGLGVEQPFLDAHFPRIYRCILYVTGQANAANDFTFRAVAPSPIGIVRGSEADLAACVAALATDGFPFRSEGNIQREIWKKTIINAVFNSICPLLDVDNGVFARDAAAARLAGEVVSECVALTDRLRLGLSAAELLDQIQLISQRSDGQLISTLQDMRAGRQTEIASFNLALARVAAALEPSLALPRVELLGHMIVAKSAQRR